MKLQKSGFLQTKTLFIIVIILAGIVFSLVAYLVFKNFFYSKRPSAVAPGKIDIGKLTGDKKIAAIVLRDEGVFPKEIQIKPGMIVSFANFTNKELNISIKGSIYAGIPVKPNLVGYSPVFEIPGEYSFSDKDNPSFSGKVIVLQKDTPKLSQKEILITDNGFIPVVMKTKKNVIIKFINKTSSDKEVISVGNLTVMSGVIKSGESWETKIYEPLQVSFQLKNDSSMTGTLQIE